MDFTFVSMPVVSQKHCFKLWKKENPDEDGLAEYRPGYEWFFVTERHSKNIIGFVALHRHFLVPTSLEQIYVYPAYRHKGLSIAIRRALVKEFDLGALTIGKFIDNPNKLERHRIVAEQSGFSNHYVVGTIDINGLSIAGDVFLRNDLDPAVYSLPFMAMPIAMLNEQLKRQQEAGALA